MPQGTYAYKVALDDSWDVNYGARRCAGGGDIALTAPGGPVTFTYDDSTQRVTDDAPVAVGSESAAQWLRKGTIALDLPEDRAGWTYRLWSAPEAGLTRDGDRSPAAPRRRSSCGVRSAPACAGLPAPGRVRVPPRPRVGASAGCRCC